MDTILFTLFKIYRVSQQIFAPLKGPNENVKRLGVVTKTGAVADPTSAFLLFAE